MSTQLQIPVEKIMGHPVLYLTNWSSRTLHGPGRRLCAMANPRRWERGDGPAPWAHIDAESVRRVLDETDSEVDAVEYRRRCDALWSPMDLSPGKLQPRLVYSGDSLLCACARPGSPRRHHPCHLELLAPYLVRAGWNVVLHGRRLAHWRHVPEHDGDTGYDAVVWADGGQEYDPAELGWPAVPEEATS